MASQYQGYGMPERLTLAYQRIPVRVRRIWSMGSSSSDLALAAIRDGHRGANHWPVFRAHIAGWRFLPGYAAGAALRRAGLGSLFDPGNPKGWASSRLDAEWKSVQPTGARNEWIGPFMVLIAAGFAYGLTSPRTFDRPKGYPANPQPTWK
jgi:hypothetical protein